MALFKVMSTFVVIVMLIVPCASWAPTLKPATRLAPTSRRRSCTVVRADDTGVAQPHHHAHVLGFGQQ